MCGPPSSVDKFSRSLNLYKVVMAAILSTPAWLAGMLGVVSYV